MDCFSIKVCCCRRSKTVSHHLRAAKRRLLAKVGNISTKKFGHNAHQILTLPPIPTYAYVRTNLRSF